MGWVRERRNKNFTRHCKPLDLTPPETPVAGPSTETPLYQKLVMSSVSDTPTKKESTPCTKHLCQKVFNQQQIPLTAEEEVERIRLQVRRGLHLTPNEYSKYKVHQQQPEAFQYKPEEALGFEPYITSKGALEEWVNTQREKRHQINCEHQGPPRTPHPAAIFRPGQVRTGYIAPTSQKPIRHIKLSAAQIESQNKFRAKFPGTSIAPKASATLTAADDLKGLHLTYADKKAYILSLY